MSHREKSLTPWITAHGIEKVVLPQSVYDAAVAQGCDMRYFIRQEMLPTDYEVSNGQIHVIDHKMPTGEQMRAEMKRKLDAGEPLGASHVPKWDGDVYAAFSVGNAPTYAPVRNDVVTDKPRPEPVTNTNAVTRHDPAETVRGLRRLLGDDMRPVSELLRGPPKPRPRRFKKNRDSVSCHDCMPGLGGRCTCCEERE